MKMFGRVLARRGIATADVAARLALAKRSPNSSHTHRGFSAGESPWALVPAKCISVFLFCIVKDNTQGVSFAGANGADTVTKVGPVVAARAANRSMMN